jgi:hypothetical protein
LFKRINHLSDLYNSFSLSTYAEDHGLCPWMNAIKNASADVAETTGG